MSENPGNGWDEWRRYVLAKLGEIEKDLRGLSMRLNQIEIDVNTHKVKIALFGVIGAAVGSVLGTIIVTYATR